MFQLPVSAIMK